MEGVPIEKTYNHIAFNVRVKDLPKFEARVRSLGLTISSLYFYDYDNHLLELHSGDLEARLQLDNQ